MENNEFRLNLIRRAFARLQTAKICKKITSLALVGALALTLSSCEIVGPTDQQLPPSFNNGGIHNGNNNNNDQTNTGTNDKDRNPIDVSGHSELLQNILLSSYYDSLIASAGSDVLQRWEYQPHPWAFYESQGLNVDAIKNGLMEAYTMSYVLDEDPNGLYMHTRVLINNTYYQNYLLRYELTDRELDDYHLMHSGYSHYYYYIQSVFMNREIAESRDPKIISTSKVLKSAFESLTESFQKTTLTATKSCDIFIMDVDQQARTLTVYVVPRMPDNEHMTIESNVAIVNSKSTLVIQEGVLCSPTSIQQLRNTSYDQLPATVYLPQAAGLSSLNHRNYEKENNK